MRDLTILGFGFLALALSSMVNAGPLDDENFYYSESSMYETAARRDIASMLGYGVVEITTKPGFNIDLTANQIVGSHYLSELDPNKSEEFWNAALAADEATFKLHLFEPLFSRNCQNAITYIQDDVMPYSSLRIKCQGSDEYHLKESSASSYTGPSGMPGCRLVGNGRWECYEYDINLSPTGSGWTELEDKPGYYEPASIKYEGGGTWRRIMAVYVSNKLTYVPINVSGITTFMKVYGGYERTVVGSGSMRIDSPVYLDASADDSLIKIDCDGFSDKARLIQNAEYYIGGEGRILTQSVELSGNPYIAITEFKAFIDSCVDSGEDVKVTLKKIYSDNSELPANLSVQIGGTSTLADLLPKYSELLVSQLTASYHLYEQLYIAISAYQSGQDGIITHMKGVSEQLEEEVYKYSVQSSDEISEEEIVSLFYPEGHEYEGIYIPVIDGSFSIPEWMSKSYINENGIWVDGIYKAFPVSDAYTDTLNILSGFLTEGPGNDLNTYENPLIQLSEDARDELCNSMGKSVALMEAVIESPYAKDTQLPQAFYDAMDQAANYCQVGG